MTSPPYPLLPRPLFALPQAIVALRRTLVVVLIVGLPLIAWACNHWSHNQAQGELLATTQGSLEVLRANLVSELKRHETVPFLLAQDHEIASLLMAPQEKAVEQLNRRLVDIAAEVHAAALYVMDASGVTVAASNWADDTSFVGQNFAYRPYFRDALESGVGHYFALGSTSRQPGYYIAYPVGAENRTRPATGGPLGVVVVKVGMAALEDAWKGGAARVAVTDADGVIVITNTEAWRFHSFQPLSAAVHARIATSQTYPDQIITPLPVTLYPQTTRPPAGGEDANAFSVEGAEDGSDHFLKLSGSVPGTAWRMHMLVNTAPAEAHAVMAAVIGGLGTLIAVLTGFHILHRWVRLQERLAGQQRTQDDLEQRVRMRTVELAAANKQLRAEMAEREKAQEVLRAAQSDLVHAAKLAALGQMSAGIAHEINQPLSAIRAFADNGVTLLDRGRTDTARDNLLQIADLTQRLATITQQLKGFARKAAGTLGAIDLNDAVTRALALVAGPLHSAAIEVIQPPPSRGIPVTVLAEEVRVQQVLVNLFSNAIDAMRGQAERRLEITVERDSEGVALRVRDTGPGIADADLPHLFDAFFTTKTDDDSDGDSAGGGLGLGLSISAGIIQDFGGTLSAANRSDGGAEFTLRLQPVAVA